jgi:internalin A
VSVLCPCAALRADDVEHKAVAFMKELGGTVTRDEKAPGNRSPPST